MLVDSERYVQTNVPDLVKDKRSGAILNVNNQKLSAYKKQKEANKRVDKMEKDLKEIRMMLIQISEKFSEKV